MPHAEVQAVSTVVDMEPHGAFCSRTRAGAAADLSRGRLVAMFVIELTYKATLAEIDANMAAHVHFLNKYYAAGHFLVSGRKIPRDGGIIVAMAKSRPQIEAIIREDPFIERGLADFRIIQFRASQRADDIPKRLA
jgi:uncharacterized protein YciI